ncbi:MAG: fused MFS/spermidine synthase [Alphaproteobacteria bacterium]|nr:fused MFS/spermidine synthase [Alphaproteobacteria bacterium]
MTGRPLLLGVAVAGALLGFVLEPLVGRLVTLSFGGAVHVWAVCMLVFQTVLLLAYVWAHFVARRFPLAHAGAVLAGLASLPLHVDAAPDPAGSVLPLVGAVLLAVGLPYFGLASAAVVAQSWVQRRGLGLPWELYAASNLGSLVGLFAYPLVVEPLFGLSAQRMVWSAGYVAYAGLVAVAAWTTRNSPATTDAIAWPAAGDVGRWVLLACAPSVLLLAVTGWIGTEFGSFPLLWTVPLGLYLGSFMVAFSERVPDAWLRPFWPDALVALALFACLAGEPVLHALLYTAFFAVCWQVHAALYRAHPEPAGLTVYYLAIALGGWIGGLFVSLIAPNVFPGLWELPIGLALCAVALLAAGEIPDWRWFTRVEWRWAVSRGALVGTMALLTGMWLNIQQSRGPVASVRSLYGVFQVRERAADDGARFRELMHGGTSHGSQYLPPDPRAKTPMSYYHPEGSNAEALARRAGGRVAGIGLGTGAIAGLMRPGEHLVFYELDPNAETLARGWFTYLADSPAQVEVRMGDARLVLAAEDTTYDALFVDAFSGDGIPTHLLTIEAFEVYLDRLAPDGVLVLHISNRFLDLRGVVRANAETLGLKGAIRVDGPEPGRDPLYGPATSMILTRSDDRLIDLSDQWIRLGPLDGLPRHAPWTDERLDLLEPLGVR